MPVLPGRIFPPKGVIGCLQASLDRLGLESVENYQVHGHIHAWYKSIESVAKDLAQCVNLGLCKTVGVSNYNKEQMIRMYEALKKEGVPCEICGDGQSYFADRVDPSVASNQIEFSLLRRWASCSGLKI